MMIKNISQNSRVQGRWLFFMMICLLLLAVSCEEKNEYPQYNPPSDHIINNDGVLHKSGLSNPELNCTACHGADLRGGSAQVSCYECHGAKW